MIKLYSPPYYAAPVVRNEVLQKYPELEPALNLLSGKINDSIMTALNYRVDYQKLQPERVAKDFLIEKGLYKTPQNGTKATIRLGSKIFAEQYILINMYSMLIKGNTQLNVETKTGLGGTKICFDALLNDQIDLYPEYTGTGFLVLLKPDKKKLEQLISNRDSVYRYVKDQFQKQYKLTWLKPIGFNNSYALMMRREHAKEIQVETITDLKRYLSNE